MSQVIVFPRGQLSAKDKERLTKSGIVAVEAEDPSKVVTVLPSASIVCPDDILMAAMAGATYSNGSCETFAKILHARLMKREAK